MIWDQSSDENEKFGGADQCRLNSQNWETTKHLLTECKTSAGTKCVEILAEKWAIDNGLLPKEANFFLNMQSDILQIEVR